MLDLHSHVLPCVDDGAKSVEMSLEMLRQAKEQGVELVAATPHCSLDGKNENIAAFLEKRQKGYEALAAAMQDNKSLYPEIILGAEVLLSCDVSELEDARLLCYQNTDYMLLEMPLDRKPSRLAEWVYNVQTKGIKPVIAHIDRYGHYKELMAEFEGLDVVYQLNASEFSTMAGRKILRNVFKRHYRFFVSSDMHNLSSRVPNIGRAREMCDKKFPKMSSMLFETSARLIVENKLFD